MPPPPPYVPIEPVSADPVSSQAPTPALELQMQADDDEQLMLAPVHAPLAELAITGDEGAAVDALMLAPPPTRAPSLVRQNGTHNALTSRSLSMPASMRSRSHPQ